MCSPGIHKSIELGLTIAATLHVACALLFGYIRVDVNVPGYIMLAKHVVQAWLAC